MRTIRRLTRFRRDFKRESKGRHGSSLAEEVAAVVTMLANDETLPARLRDHALTGDWAWHRECHLNPDLLLIYAKLGEDGLALVRLGSHSELRLM